MMDDDERMALVHSVRQLSTNIDAAALEIGPALDEAFTAQLMQMSVRLSNAADMIEDPSLADREQELPGEGCQGRHRVSAKLLH